LQNWEYDAVEADVAGEEGMHDDDNDVLRRVLLALRQLAGGLDVEHIGATKQHGLMT
jgi:hypothetical protein